MGQRKWSMFASAFRRTLRWLGGKNHLKSLLFYEYEPFDVFFDIFWCILDVFLMVWTIHQRSKACKTTFRIFQFHGFFPLRWPNSLWGDTIERVDESHWRCWSETCGQHVVSNPSAAIGTLPGEGNICEWYLVTWWDVGMVFRTLELIPVVALENFVESCRAAVILVHLFGLKIGGHWGGLTRHFQLHHVSVSHVWQLICQ